MHSHRSQWLQQKSLPLRSRRTERWIGAILWAALALVVLRGSFT
jgi:hypothetical protein